MDSITTAQPVLLANLDVCRAVLQHVSVAMTDFNHQDKFANRDAETE